MFCDQKGVMLHLGPSGVTDCLSRDLAVTIQVENAERCPANVLTATYSGGDQLPSHLKGWSAGLISKRGLLKSESDKISSRIS